LHSRAVVGPSFFRRGVVGRAILVSSRMDIRKKQLKNGLVIVSDAMAGVRSVSVGVWVRVGSRAESKETHGISHFIEHLLFKGTRNRTAAKLAEEIDSIGGQLNAFTDKEYVGFYAKVLDAHLVRVFEILSDIVLNPTFPAAELRRERNVICEEINMVEDSPQELIHELFLEHFWPDHPLGLPISGTKASVQTIKRAAVVRYFCEHYTACNTVISVAGNIRHSEVQRLAERHFTALPSGTPPAVRSAPESRPALVVRQKAHLEQTHLCLGTRAPSLMSPDRYCAHVLSHVLGGGVSSRLFQNIRERRGLVYSIDSTLDLYRDAGNLVVYAGVAPGAAEMVLDLTFRELRRLKECVIPAEELRRAKEFLKSSVVLSLESSSSRMTQLAQQEIYYERFVPVQEVLDSIERIEARSIRRLANELLQGTSMALVVLGNGSVKGLHNVTVEI
jgi:predicted Zn-dependent peptidase